MFPTQYQSSVVLEPGIQIILININFPRNRVYLCGKTVRSEFLFDKKIFLQGSNPDPWTNSLRDIYYFLAVAKK